MLSKLAQDGVQWQAFDDSDEPLVSITTGNFLTS
jgi:hypothetical protein